MGLWAGLSGEADCMRCVMLSQTSLWLMAPGFVKFMTPVSLRLACSRQQREKHTAHNSGWQSSHLACPLLAGCAPSRCASPQPLPELATHCFPHHITHPRTISME